MTPAGLLGTLSDWYERNQDKLVGSGIRGAATRGLLGLEPPKDATKAEMEAYRNFANASMALAAGPVAATRAVKGAKTLKNAPQAEALETARQNAVKMLGLPESNTAMDRARAMGFDVDGFHGMPAPMRGSGFDPAMVAKNDYGAIGQGVYIDPSKDASYANAIINLLGNPSGSNVIPVKVRSGNMMDAADLPAIYSAERSKAVTEGLKQRGVDSVMSVVDGKPNELMVIDPSRIRSRFAAFDPARIDEKDLLASLAAMGITLPLTMGLLSDQTD